MFGRIRTLTLALLVSLLATVAFAQGMAPQDTSAVLGLMPTVDPGPRISLDVQEAEIGTVLRSLASFSGVNIVASPRVIGKVTVKLEQVPWREALEVILNAHQFDYIQEYGIIRVDTAEDLRNESVAEKMAEKQIDDLQKLTLGIAPMRFASAEEVKGALEDMLTQRGSLEVDVRTNSLLINDIAERVGLIQQLAVELDSRTPQVEINARLVDLDRRATKELGISWGVNNFKPSGANMAGQAMIDNAIQDPIGTATIGTVQDWGELYAQLDALERDNKATLISNPIITTTDNREASILVGQKIPLIVADEAGNAMTQLTTIGILLKVTPHINEDDLITLDVHNEVSDLSSQATVQGGVIINTSESDTRVLVRSGDTAIIGGLIRTVESTLQSGIPVLQDIPLLGALFRHESKADDTRELVVFVTPRIVTDEYMQRGQISMHGKVERTPDDGLIYH